MLDPRRYTLDYPQSNTVIANAIEVLNNNLPQAQLDQVLIRLLKQENDALINVALNLSPSNAVAKIIWESLNRAVLLSADVNSSTHLFAIPIILVAGSKSQTKLPGKIDSDELNNFFKERQLFNPAFECYISGKLIDPKAIAAIVPSQLCYWARSIKSAKLWLPISVEGSSVEVVNEGVFLRFLVGVGTSISESASDKLSNNDAMNTNNSVSVTDAGVSNNEHGCRVGCINFNAINDDFMGLMQLIHAQLQTDGVTLFPIPFIPVTLSEAFAAGMFYRTEIALQVAVSNVVRKIREHGLTPIAKVGSSDEAIKIVITPKEAQENSNLSNTALDNNTNMPLCETSLWNMTRFDDFDRVMLIINNLLYDVGVEVEYVTNFN